MGRTPEAILELVGAVTSLALPSIRFEREVKRSPLQPTLYQITVTCHLPPGMQEQSVVRSYTVEESETVFATVDDIMGLCEERQALVMSELMSTVAELFKRAVKR